MERHKYKLVMKVRFLTFTIIALIVLSCKEERKPVDNEQKTPTTLNFGSTKEYYNRFVEADAKEVVKKNILSNNSEVVKVISVQFSDTQHDFMKNVIVRAVIGDGKTVRFSGKISKVQDSPKEYYIDDVSAVFE